MILQPIVFMTAGLGACSVVVGIACLCSTWSEMDEFKQKRKAKNVDRENLKTQKSVSTWFIIIGVIVFTLSWIMNSVYKLDP